MSRSFGPHVTNTSWSNSIDDAASQQAKVLDRPELRSAVGPAGVQRHNSTVTTNAKSPEYCVGRKFVGRHRGQFQPK